MTGRIEKTVFISYRRTNLPWALAMYQNLTASGYDVFFDYNSIKSGDFEQIITQNIRGRAHFVVLLTPSALKRCNEPGDWLRREIEIAIDEKRNIVPLFFEGFSFSSPSVSKFLTGKLELLKKYNGMTVPAEYFDAAMTRLRSDFLNIPLSAVLHPITNSVEKAVKVQKAAAGKAKEVKQKELSAQEWFEQGYKHGEAKNHNESIRCYTEAIRLRPDYADAYNNRGSARNDKGDLDGALKDYDEAIRLKPDFGEPYLGHGIVRTAKGDLDGALKDYDEAIRLKPDYADAYLGRGIVRTAKGDLDGALKDYDEVIRLRPDYADAYNNRGSARNDKGDLDGALKDYDEAIRLKPDFGEPYLGRGNVRRAKGDLDGALKDYDEAIRLKPDYADAYQNHGLARYDQGDLDSAIKDFTEVIRLKPDSANAYWGRGSAWWMKENFYSAAADYQKYFDLGGTDETVRQYLQDAKKRISN